MDSRAFSLRWLPLLAVAVRATVSSLEAQPAATNAWQPIIFSSPGSTEISSNVMSHSAQPSFPDFQGKLHVLQDASPVVNFGNPPLPAGPVPMPSQMRRFQKTPNNSLDWEFMTPAEIMGVAPDQILQTQTGNTNGEQSSLTPMERFLEGQNSSTRFYTNSFGNSSPGQNFWANGDDQTNNASSGLVSGGWGNLASAIFNPSLKNAPSDNLFANPNGDSSWSKVFGSPSPSPAPNPAQQQQQGMSQFMQLLNPESTPVTAATAPDVITSLKAQTVLSDFDSTEPLGNPIGASFAPLSSGISKPIGLAPLPTITRQASAQPAAPPAWAPQPPPWLSSTPQPFAIPQSKF